jgi:Na+/H+ antiporter NhaA
MVRVGDHTLALDLRHWVNDGLMVFFFFVVGLEVKRELVMGELTDRRRAALPLCAAVTGLAVPAGIYLGFNPDGEAAQAWGVVISTDTAFLLGLLALVGPARAPALRLFLLTLAVVDDVGALAVIALFYTDQLSVGWLLVAVLGLIGMGAMRYLHIWRGPAYLAVGTGIWLATYESGVHPTIAGVAIAMLIPAFPPRREEVEEAERLTRTFRQSPQPELARAARMQLDRTVSGNERMSLLVSPWSTWVVVPIFALANAGVRLNGEILRDAFTSAVTLGVITGLVGGKLLGVLLGAGLSRALGLSRAVPGLTPSQLVGGAALSGIGFTISLFIVDLALDDPRLADQARVGVLTGSVLAALLGWAVFAFNAYRSPEREDAPVLLDPPVDPERDHIVGPVDAPLTLVEYADFECPFCAQATGVLEDLRDRFGDQLRYVYRHMPLEVHPHAELAAEAAEAADAQGKFWEMHDQLFRHPDRLTVADMLGHAEAIGLNVAKFAHDLGSGRYAARVEADVISAAASKVRGTPTFFVNGRRHRGATDVDTLTAALLVDQDMTLPLDPEPAAAVRPPVGVGARAVDPASLPPADIPNPEKHTDAMFPSLTPGQIAVLNLAGHVESFRRGDVLFAVGDPSYDLFVVLDGVVAVFADHGTPAERVVAMHRAGSFIGEYNLLTGGPVFYTAIGLAGGRVLRVPAEAIGAALDADRTLSQLIMRTFLLRRARLLKLGEQPTGAPVG